MTAPFPGGDAQRSPRVEFEVDGVAQRFDALVANIERVIQGKDAEVRLALTCLLAEGHLLIEDVPGVGKTSLARAIASSIGGSWHRIQFTPDLLPSDVTGVSIFNQATRTFEFHPGPVFANIVLGDEINRASPKTQSALLEVMEERQVTVDGAAHAAPRPFLVIATQNPVDLDGTYRLPEAQLDRFLLRLSLGYPDEAAELEVLTTQIDEPTVVALRPVLSVDQVAAMVHACRGVRIADSLRAYVVRLVAATRRQPELRLGASPRGSLALLRAARVLAASRGRDYVAPDDLKTLAVPVLAHRLILSPEAEIQGRTAVDVLEALLATQPVPQSLAPA